jgi:hypothetical protein
MADREREPASVRVAAIIAALEIPVAGAALVLVTTSQRFVELSGYLAVLLLALELGKWLLARKFPAVPPDDLRRLYAETPLSARDRWIVRANLMGLPLGLALLIPLFGGGSGGSDAEIAIVGAAVVVPVAVSLVRVLRHDSWLAVSPIPSRRTRRRPG